MKLNRRLHHFYIHSYTYPNIIPHPPSTNAPTKLCFRYSYVQGVKGWRESPSRRLQQRSRVPFPDSTFIFHQPELMSPLINYLGSWTGTHVPFFRVHVMFLFVSFFRPTLQGRLGGRRLVSITIEPDTSLLCFEFAGVGPEVLTMLSYCSKLWWRPQFRRYNQIGEFYFEPFCLYVFFYRTCCGICKADSGKYMHTKRNFGEVALFIRV